MQIHSFSPHNVKISHPSWKRKQIPGIQAPILESSTYPARFQGKRPILTTLLLFMSLLNNGHPKQQSHAAAQPFYPGDGFVGEEFDPLWPFLRKSPPASKPSVAHEATSLASALALANKIKNSKLSHYERLAAGFQLHRVKPMLVNYNAMRQMVRQDHQTLKRKSAPSTAEQQRQKHLENLLKHLDAIIAARLQQTIPPILSIPYDERQELIENLPKAEQAFQKALKNAMTAFELAYPPPNQRNF